MTKRAPAVSHVRDYLPADWHFGEPVLPSDIVIESEADITRAERDCAGYRQLFGAGVCLVPVWLPRGLRFHWHVGYGPIGGRRGYMLACEDSQSGYAAAYDVVSAMSHQHGFWCPQCLSIPEPESECAAGKERGA